MDEVKTENTRIVENIPAATPSGSGNKKMLTVLVAVVLVVGLAAAGFLYFMGNNQDMSAEDSTPVAMPTKLVEQPATATPVPTQPQGSGSAETLAPLSSGNSPDDILKDLNSTTISSFGSDFADLQKDAAGL